MLSCYRLSKYLIIPALNSIKNSNTISFSSVGTNYRLPSNLIVVKFVIKMYKAALGRILYGAFWEKKWTVSSTKISADSVLESIRNLENGNFLMNVPVNEKYTFYADCFFGENTDEILVEAVNRRTGKGEIVLIEGDKQIPISGFNGHVSYPSTVFFEGQNYIVPETAAWAPVSVYKLKENVAENIFQLNIDDQYLIDPTICNFGERCYLFANTVSDGSSVLHLWTAPSLKGRFERHPASPIRVGAQGSRMGGEILAVGGELFRFGQRFQKSYGDGLLCYKINCLTPDIYEENFVTEVAFVRRLGPHTLNIRDGIALFDSYTEEFSLLAGVRRVLSKL
jgi:hypothetical protein